MDGQQTPAHNDGRREQDNSSRHSNNTMAIATDRGSGGNDEGGATSATINTDGSTTDVRPADVSATIWGDLNDRLPDVGGNAGGRLDCIEFQQPLLSFPSQLCPCEQNKNSKSRKEVQEEIFNILDQVEWILSTPPDEIWSSSQVSPLPLPPHQ